MPSTLLHGSARQLHSMEQLLPKNQLSHSNRQYNTVLKHKEKCNIAKYMLSIVLIFGTEPLAQTQYVDPI